MSGSTLPSRRFAGRPGTAPIAAPPVEVVPGSASRTRVRAGRLWLVQAVTGAALVGFLGLHLAAQHFLAPGGLRDYASVVDYLRQPIVMVAELGLVLAVVVHASLGLRASIVELVSSPHTVHRATIAIAVVGALIVAYAALLTWRLVA